jgi:hypothetical protein
MTTTPADVTAILGRLIEAAYHSEETVIVDTAISAGLMWRCPCKTTNALEDTSCDVCGKDRPWARDQTPPRYGYGELLTNLREGLKEWFDARPRIRRPAAVTFRITTGYDDGVAWATNGATVHFTDSPTGLAYPEDFTHSAVADALVEVSEFDRPQTCDTLRVSIPAI